MTVPVLTYHGVNVNANTYQENDHFALASDLRTINELGLEIVPLRDVVDWHQGLIADDKMARKVAISFDDGSWFDFYDLEHPTCGPQRSLLNILRDFQAEVGRDRQPQLHATSFVISSPAARQELDTKGLIGKGWWGDDWWKVAQNSGLLSIECHSWDHLHPDVDQVAQERQLKGNFEHVQSYADCNVQFTKAAEYIAKQLGGLRPALFAYPWGRVSNYVVQEYLPGYRHRHQFMAAFTTEPRPISASDNIWMLPRYVCGRDWISPGGLEKILSSSV